MKLIKTQSEASTLEPPLKAMNPNTKMKPPRAIRGVECPEIGSDLLPKRPIRGPRVAAPEISGSHWSKQLTPKTGV